MCAVIGLVKFQQVVTDLLIGFVRQCLKGADTEMGIGAFGIIGPLDCGVKAASIILSFELIFGIDGMFFTLDKVFIEERCDEKLRKTVECRFELVRFNRKDIIGRNLSGTGVGVTSII